MDAPCRIRPADAADIPAVAQIERRTFTDAWSPSVLAAHLDDLFLVAEADDGVAGYAVVRRAGNQAELLNFAVDASARRRGIGGTLLDAAIHEAARRGSDVLFLEVRPSNAGARALYARRGFVDVGRRRGYYRDPPEDALVLACPIGGPA